MSILSIEAIGYINYKRRLSQEEYSEKILEKIIEHRETIMTKYASAEDKTIGRAVGMCYSKGLLIPTDYDGVVIDTEDVYASAYNICYSKGVWKKIGEKFAYWILFTNDPYVPVIPMVCIQNYNLFELLLRKEKNELKPVIERLCPNLKYPVSTMKELQKVVANEYNVRGRAKKEFVLDEIENALKEQGLFDLNVISCEVGSGTKKLLNKYGYEIM